MSFELFTHKSTRRGEPHISITKQGTFQINAACMDAHLYGVDAVQLLYDAPGRRIALKPVAADDEHAYKIARNKQRGGSLAGRAFLRHYQINHSETRRYPATWLDNPGALVINLG